MAQVKCLTCGLNIKVENLLTSRCPRCGTAIPSNCFSCAGNCFSCDISEKSKPKDK